MSEILHIDYTKIDENYTLQNLKFIQMRSKSFWVLGCVVRQFRARCPSVFSDRTKCTTREFRSIAIEPTVSVALRRSFKKAGSVLSDIGDSWDKDF